MRRNVRPKPAPEAPTPFLKEVGSGVIHTSRCRRNLFANALTLPAVRALVADEIELGIRPPLCPDCRPSPRWWLRLKEKQQ